jgi:hypothetical protein
MRWPHCDQVDYLDGLHKTGVSHKSVHQGASAGLENAHKESKQGVSGVIVCWIIHLESMAGISILTGQGKLCHYSWEC